MLLCFMNSYSLSIDIFVHPMEAKCYYPFISWHDDVFVVVEPGELAKKFLQNVKFSLSSTMSVEIIDRS